MLLVGGCFEERSVLVAKVYLETCRCCDTELLVGGWYGINRLYSIARRLGRVCREDERLSFQLSLQGEWIVNCITLKCLQVFGLFF